MDKEEVKITLKETFQSVLDKTKSSFSFWSTSPDFLNLQTSLVNLGTIVDYGYLGGMIIPYIQHLLVESKRNRFSENVQDLDKKFLAAGTIHTDFAQSELGHKIFEHTFKTFIEQENKSKIEAQKLFLLNSFTNLDIDEELASSYQDTLISLRPLELQIFQALFSPDKMIEQIFELKFPKGDDYTVFSLKTDIMNYLHIEEHLFEKSIKQLISADLITEKEISIPWSSGNFHKSNMSQIMDRAKTDAHRLITNYGKNFMESIT